MSVPECANLTTPFSTLESFSPAFATYSTVFMVVVLSVLFFSLVAWFPRRHHPYLAPRRFSLVLVSTLGIIIQTFPGTLERTGVRIPCVLDLWSFQLCIILATWPLTVRIISVYYQILYNEVLAEQLVKELDGGSLLSNESYTRQKWRASSRFRFILTSTVLGFSALLTLTTSLIQCNMAFDPCTSLEEFQPALLGGFFVLACLVAFLLAVNLYAVYLTRDSPDPIDVRSETITAWVVAMVVGIPGLVGYLFDFGGFNQQIGSDFTWLLFIDWAFFLFLVLTVSVPVYRSRSVNTNYKVENFESFLDSPAGLRFFSSYLATEASVDNLLFYRAVTRWIEDYDVSSEEYRSNQARRILNDYLLPYAEHEVFVGYKILGDIKENLNGLDEITKNVFDAAKNAVVRVMYTDSYCRFEKSDFYKMYLHEVEPEGSTAAEYEALSVSVGGSGGSTRSRHGFGENSYDEDDEEGKRTVEIEL